MIKYDKYVVKKVGMDKKRKLNKEVLKIIDEDRNRYKDFFNATSVDTKALSGFINSNSSVIETAKQFAKISETSSLLAKSFAVPSESMKGIMQLINTPSDTIKQMTKIIGTPSETFKDLFQTINSTSAIAKEFASINKSITAPYEDMLKSLRVSLLPFEEIKSSLLNTTLKTTLDFEKFDNGILRRGTTVLENSTLNNFQLTRQQSYEALLKPVENTPLPDNETQKEISKLRGEVSELKTLLLKVTQEKMEQTSEYIIELIKKSSPQKLYLSYGSKEVSFRNDTNMAKICDYVFRNATKTNLSVSIERLLQELFGIDIFTSDKDEVVEHKEKIRKTIINLNNKIEQKLGKTPFTYTKDTIEVVRS